MVKVHIRERFGSNLVLEVMIVSQIPNLSHLSFKPKYIRPTQRF